MNEVATLPVRQPVSASMQALVPRSIPEAISLSETLSQASLVPEHLRGKPGDCLLVVMQAQRWGMDALSVAQCTSVVRGKLCYEGKLVAAVLYAMGAIDGRLRYEFAGEGDKRSIRVIGKPRGMTVDQEVTGTVAGWKTDNGNWQKNPDDMLVYRGTRQWARRYAPEALLGVYTPDELDEQQDTIVATIVSSAPARSAYPDDAFATNLPKWREVITSGRKSADDIIALATTKGDLSEAQAKAIRDCAAEPTGVAA